MPIDPTRDSTPRPASLPRSTSSRLPVDGGLAGLGLVTLAAAGAGVTMTLALFVLARTFGVGGSGGAIPTMLIFAASLVRSGFHIGVGRAAMKRSPLLAEAAVRYLWASGAQTVLVMLVTLFMLLDQVSASSFLFVVALGSALMAWPVTLWLLVSQRSMKAIFGTAKTFDLALVPADRSVTSAGLLMTVFGTLFLSIDIGLFFFLVADGTAVTRSTVIWFLMLALFAARSCMHIGWGLAALRGRMDFPAFNRATTIYLWLAFGTALAALGAMFAIEEFRNAFRNAPINIIYVAVIIVSSLMAWPVALRGFVQDTVPFWDLEADHDRPFRPAVDRGLTALGYLHICFAVTWAAQWLLALLGVGLAGLVDGSDTPGVLALIVAGATIGAQLWAGLELSGMRPRYRLAVLVYVGLSVVSAITTLLFDSDPDDGPGGAFTIVELLVTLVVPLMTLALSRLTPPADDVPVGPTAP